MGGAVLAALTVRMFQVVKELERRLDEAPRSKFEQDANLDRRALALNVAAHLQLAARDNLEALRMLSPDMARQVARDFLPETE